jgi:streptogramin lyase
VTDFLTELREELLDGLERYDRTPWWRRARASRSVVRGIAVAAVAVAAALVGVQLAGRAPDDDQATARDVSRLEGFQATAAAATDGTLWVTQHQLANLLRIDLHSGAVRARIDVGGSPGGVIASGGAIWVHDWERGRLLRVDPRTDRVVKSLTLGQVNSGDVAFADGAVWTAGDRDQLWHIDPKTASVTRRIPLGRSASAGDKALVGMLAPAGDVMWVVMGDGAVLEIDIRSGRRLGSAHVPALPTELARRAVADDSGLWVSSPQRREVLHIDARTRHVSRYAVGGDPGGIAIVDGRVWVATLHETGTVTRVTVLDERDGHVVATLPVPLAAVNIVPSPTGGAWITFGEDGAVSPAAIRISGP